MVIKKFTEMYMMLIITILSLAREGYSAGLCVEPGKYTRALSSICLMFHTFEVYILRPLEYMFNYQFSPINSPFSLREFFVWFFFLILANSFESEEEGREIHMLFVFCKGLYMDFKFIHAAFFWEGEKNISISISVYR